LPNHHGGGGFKVCRVLEKLREGKKSEEKT